MHLLLSVGNSPLQMKKTLYWEILETFDTPFPRRYKATSDLLRLCQRDL